MNLQCCTLSATKVQDGVFTGPEIRRLIKDKSFTGLDGNKRSDFLLLGKNREPNYYQEAVKNTVIF